MFKRICASLLLVLLMLTLNTPVFASSKEDINIHHTIDTTFVENISLNGSANKEKVEFVSIEEYTDKSGYVIPKGTVFTGRIHGLKKSRWAFRRAKAGIKITEMRFPDGEVYPVSGTTKRNKLKGSAVGNVAKGIVCAPAAIAVGVGGTVVMLVEAVSIVGIPFLVPTGVTFGGVMGKLTNGVDYKRHQGDEITLKISKAKYIHNEYEDRTTPIEDMNEEF